MLPSALGNSGPSCRLALTIGPGPRRVVEDGDRPRLYIPAARRRRRMPPPDLARCRKILVVKPDFIGDWVMTTPFLENLRASAPRAEITAGVLDRVFTLAETCRFVDRVISIGRAEGRRIVFGAADRATLAAFGDDYRRGAFDLAIVPRYDADFNGALAIAHGSGARSVVGFSEMSTPRRRSLNRGDDRFYTMAITDPRPVAHESERELALLEALGGTVKSRRPSLDVRPADEAAAGEFLDGAIGRKARGFLAVAPFGSEAKKTLPAAELAPVIRGLAARFELDILVIASPGDAAAADLFAVGIGAQSTTRGLGLRATAALLRKATAFIGMDSGPAHIAAAMGTPVAVLACHPLDGSPIHTNAPERFAPVGATGQVTIIRPARAKASCIEGCEEGEAHCILGLTDEILSRRLDAFLGGATASDGASKSQSRRRRASAMDARA